MFIVGERINASRKKVAPAIENKDSEAIGKEARDQIEAGADTVDVNAGIFVDREEECLRWLVETVQGAIDRPLCLDSPSPAALAAALGVHKGKALVNSISLEKSRIQGILPLLKEHGAAVVALCMGDEGMPKTAGERVENGKRLVGLLTDNGVALGDIYLDPMVQPVGTGHTMGIQFLESVRALKQALPEAHTMCGLSNISFGLPQRKTINRVFAVLGAGFGLDGLMIDPLDKNLMRDLIIAETLMGRDEHCVKYLKAFRAGRIVET